MILQKLPYKTFSLFFILYSLIGTASASCCSHHGGVAGCDAYSGRYVCRDGHLSRCYCERVYYYNEDFFDEYDGGYHEHHGHHFHHHNH